MPEQEFQKWQRLSDLFWRLQRGWILLRLKPGAPSAYYLRQLIEQDTEEMEDYYLSADTLERMRKGQEQIYSTDAVRKIPSA